MFAYKSNSPLKIKNFTIFFSNLIRRINKAIKKNNLKKQNTKKYLYTYRTELVKDGYKKLYDTDYITIDPAYNEP